MSPRRSSRTTGGLVVTLVVGVLAVTAVLLAVFALRVPSNPDAGEIPGPIPTWGGGTNPGVAPTSTPSPTSVDEPVSPSPQFLSMYDGTFGIRATAGSCTGAPAVVQRTSDGGATWTAVTFDGVDVRQVLALDYVSDSQINVVAAAADCTQTVVTSFTGGEFWQAYPEQIGSATYVQPTDQTTVRVEGTNMTAPCTVREVQSVTQTVVVLCSDGSVQVRSSAGAWAPANVSRALAMAPSGPSGLVLAVSEPTCSGVLIRSIDVSSGASTDLSCLAAEQANATIDLVSSSVFYWSGADFFTSKTGGASWSSAG